MADPRIRLAAIAALVLGTGPAPAQTPMERLVAAYPDELKAVEGDVLVWRDGTRMPIGHPGASAEAALEAPTIADIAREPYPVGKPTGEPTTDPGRYRPAAFFAKLYGDCTKGEVERRLVPVRWLPTNGGGTVRVTPRGGVAAKLQAVSDELDRLPARYLTYLKPSAGTYNCRKIAGTDLQSAHGYGIAIDIATKHSDYWRWSKGGFRNQIPYEIVEVFERHGFIWGGKWKHFDTMHFEYRPELLPAAPTPSTGGSLPVKNGATAASTPMETLVQVVDKSGPDYSGVTSREDASRLAAKGELVPIQLLPRMFGGDDGPANTVFVPPFAAELKQRTDENIVRPAVEAGKVTRYSAVPSYSGNSFVPASITIRAHDPGEFNFTIAIWGEKLPR